jgi:hypothetical protein
MTDTNIVMGTGKIASNSFANQNAGMMGSGEPNMLKIG